MCGCHVTVDGNFWANTMHALPLLALTLLLVFISFSAAKDCEGLSIRNNVNQLEQLRNCTVITGSLEILLMENSADKEFEKYSFPDLREISDYFMLFRVRKLKSLSSLFPNLRVIRGQKLFLDYAFVMYENLEISDVSCS